MKHLIGVVLMLCSLSCLGQTVADAPFKKANVILVQTSDSARVALRKLAQVLVQQGYTLKKVDTEYGTLLTDPKVVNSGWKPVLTIQAVAVAGGLRLSGQSSTDMATLGTATSPVQFAGAEGGVFKSCFREIEKAAKAYPGGSLRYTQQ